jgi:hypothetical protein
MNSSACEVHLLTTTTTTTVLYYFQEGHQKSAALEMKGCIE